MLGIAPAAWGGEQYAAHEYVTADTQFGTIAAGGGTVGSVATGATMNEHSSALVEVRTAEAIDRPERSSSGTALPGRSIGVALGPDIDVT